VGETILLRHVGGDVLLLPRNTLLETETLSLLFRGGHALGPVAAEPNPSPHPSLSPNPIRLVERTPQVCERFPHVNFVVGGDGPKYGDLVHMRRTYALESRVELLGAGEGRPGTRHPLLRGHATSWQSAC
jgi:hypothetical protein